MEEILTSVGNGRIKQGSYVLRIEATAVAQISFGRFFGGRAIEILPGDYLYVGSAMGGLAPRLLRHASRIDPHRPHAIRQKMLADFPAMGLSERPIPPVRKKLHWHIDYLLDDLTVNLSGVFIIRSAVKLETAVAAMLIADPATSTLRNGLGASDAKGPHLLRVDADAAWWAQFLPRLRAQLPPRLRAQLPPRLGELL